MPISNIVTLLIIIKICGRISASRLHKIVYILKMKIPYTFKFKDLLFTCRVWMKVLN